MGSSSLLADQNFSRDHWNRIGSSPHYDLLLCTKGQRPLLREYSRHYPSPAHLEQDFERFKLRLTPMSYVVGLVAVLRVGRGEGCCGESSQLRVITEHVTQYLGEDQRILERPRKTLVQAAKGFCQLRTRLGWQGRVTREMIGFDSSGEVRVWLSKNFAKNEPDLCLERVSSNEDQTARSLAECVLSYAGPAESVLRSQLQKVPLRLEALASLESMAK